MNAPSFEAVFIPVFILSLFVLAIAGIIFLFMRINRQEKEAQKAKPKSKYDNILQYAESSRYTGLILAGLGLYSYYLNQKDNPSNALPIAAAIVFEGVLIVSISWLLSKRKPLVVLPFGLSVGMLGAVPLVKQFDFAIGMEFVFIFVPVMTAGVLFHAWREGWFTPQNEAEFSLD